MEELVEQMHNDKNLVQLVRDLIRSLKVKYDKIGLFADNRVANVDDIVSTIHNSKGIAWRKSLEGKVILDVEDYNMIIELTMELRLFQEGSLHDKLDKQTRMPETEETKAEIMEKCALLFSNIAEAHKINLAVATDLKDLSYLIKELEVFSRIAQAATQPLIACYTPQIDKFIKE